MGRHFLEKTEEWLSARVTITPSGCWEWNGKRSQGYGVTAEYGKEIKAHRVAFKIRHGRYPEYTRHTCNNPPCCNPDHLKEGTHAENMQDYSDTVTFCKHGHPYDKENTYVNKQGYRKCRACAHGRYERRVQNPNYEG